MKATTRIDEAREGEQPAAGQRAGNTRAELGCGASRYRSCRPFLRPFGTLLWRWVARRMISSWLPAAGQDAGETALAHHRDTVGEPQDFGQFGGDDDDRACPRPRGG